MRRESRLRFSIRTALIILTISCVGLSWLALRFRKRALAAQRIECSRASYELIRNRIPAGEGEYFFKAIWPTGIFQDGTAAEQFEKDLVLDFQSIPTKKGYTVHRGNSGKPYYYFPIRAKDGCVECHRRTSGVLKSGDLIAVWKLQRPKSY